MTARLAAILAATIVTAACADPPDEPVEPIADSAASVTTAIARIETLRDELVLSGTVVPASLADWTIYAPEAGIVAEMPFAMNEEVQPGDLLVRFDILSVTQTVRAREALVEEANRQVEDAQREVDRLQPLFDQGLIARNELESARRRLTDARSAATRAQAEVDLVQVLEDTTRVTARFAGIVHTAWKAPGDFVMGGEDDPVLRVVDPARTQIAIDVSRERLSQLQAGNIATILLPDGQSTVGSVTRIEAPALATDETAVVRLGYQTPEPLPLDTIVRVELTLNERPDVVVVPEEALLQDGSGRYVMLANDDLTVSHRAVRVGLITGGLAQITQGLEAGDRVVVSGAADLIDGQAIRVAR